MPSKRGKSNPEKVLARTQQRLVRSIAYRWSYFDTQISETIWTPKTRSMVEEGLRVSFGFVSPHLFEDDGTVLSDSRGKGAYQKQ